MKNIIPIRRRAVRERSLRHPWRAATVAFCATMLAWPAAANFDIPDEPLTAGSRIPANLMFILDNSASMTTFPGTEMSNPDVSTVCWRQTDGGGCQNNAGGLDISDNTYTSNTIYFNPSVQYLPWQTAVDGVRLSNASFTAAYRDPALASGSTDNLSGSVQTYYVPKDPTSTSPSYLGNTANYYRYQLRTDGKLVRAQLENTPGGSTESEQVLAVNDLRAYRNAWARSGTNGNSTNTTAPTNASWDFYVPSGASNLRATISGNDPNANVYIRRNSRAATNQGGSNNTARCNTSGNSSAESCTVSSPQSGTWYAAVRAGNNNNDNFTGVSLVVTYDISSEGSLGCATSSSGIDWRHCTEVPGAAQVRANYANWYAYHRTRMKAAKAAASEAFSRLEGTNVRVGFRTINPQLTANRNFDIPVTSNGGIFVNASGSQNRTNWYDRLHGATAGTGNGQYTPLRTALADAGEYFGTEDPYQSNTVTPLSCRQNFTILTTAGYWNRAFDRPDEMVANSDGTSGPNGYVAEAPYVDGYSNTLADVAMHYWKTDLRDDLANNVPTTAANPANWQHMVTFGLSMGARGTVNPLGPYPGQAGGLANWPDPIANYSDNTTDEIPARIDDLLHAAVNSRGRFIAASNPAEFADGLEAALAAIEERTGSFSNVAANSTTLDAGARVFQANFVSGVWTGELRSQPVTLAGGVSAVDCSGVAQPAVGWCASKGIPTSGRKVYTSDGHFHDDGENPASSEDTTSGQPARVFPDDATDEQLASLARDGLSGEHNAAYIAGDRSRELSRPDGTLRNRNHLLGDIIGSSPAYVPGVSGAAGTVYVGANDGMLHAFDVTNGNELFAYIPGILNWHHLGTLSQPNYGHRFFVDGPIVVTSRQQTPNQNILVGALGKGGKGLFALDVTSPATFGAGDNVKWERAETPNGNMGLVQGRPLLAKVQNSVTSTNAVVLGNGLNSTSGVAALIVLDLDTGDVIKEIAVGTAGVANGLSAPTGVLGPDGSTISHVYAGDMLGNVWKFNLTSSDPDDWSGTRLFTATDAAGLAQPISGGLTLAVHPRTNERWVFFGTGRYMLQEDIASTAVQSMYGFVDDGTAIARRGADANLTQRTIEVSGEVVNGYPVRGFQQRTALPDGSKGWFIDLPASGERIVQDAQVVSTFLITASVIPSGDSCESGGSGFINALDAFTGTSAGGSYFNLDGSGSTNEVVGDPARPVGSVNVGGGMPTLPNLLRGRFVVGGSGGSDVRGTQTLAPRWDRASWREIRGD